MYLMGALDSEQFFIAWENQLSSIKMHDVVFCLPKYINNKINHSQ
jgi:esterase/lipase superfamily enzyme